MKIVAEINYKFLQKAILDSDPNFLTTAGRLLPLQSVVSPREDFWLPPPQFGSIFGSSRTKPSFWILKALPPRSPDQVLWRELRSMEALGEIKRK